jgi:antitoxin (DNA-binding transcriptional repressor) of toxin-antitoxin stability system
MHQVPLEEAKTRLSDLIDAALRGEEVAIAADDQRAVKLVPVRPRKRRRQFGFAKGLIVMTEDFDAPLPEFEEYSR